MNRQEVQLDLVTQRLNNAADSHDVIITAQRAYQNQADAIINGTDGTEFRTAVAGLNDAIQKSAAMADTADEKVWAEEMKVAARAFADNFQIEILPRIEKLNTSANALERANLTEEIKAADAKTDGILTKLISSAEKTNVSLTAEGIQAMEEHDSEIAEIKSFFIAFAIIACVIGVVMGFYVARGITRPVAALVKGLGQIAIGDLSARVVVGSKDEIGELSRSANTMAEALDSKAKLAVQIGDGDLRHEVKLASDRDTLGLALQKMVTNLREVVANVRSAAENVSSGSEELTSTSQTLSTGSAEQAASVEEVSASMEESAASIQQNASASEEMASSSEELASQAEQLQSSIAFFKVSDQPLRRKVAAKSNSEVETPVLY
jgi:methyl-accepting chemotaxis protein